MLGKMIVHGLVAAVVVASAAAVYAQVENRPPPVETQGIRRADTVSEDGYLRARDWQAPDHDNDHDDDHDHEHDREHDREDRD